MCATNFFIWLKISQWLLMVAHPDLYPDEITNNVETSNLIWIVVVGWLISVAIQVRKMIYNDTSMYFKILIFIFLNVSY